MVKKVLIGTVTLERDTPMMNLSFQYAADFEELMIPRGEYPVYAYADDLTKDSEGRTCLGWRNYIGFEGTVLRSAFGRAGGHGHYHQHWYNYELAKAFIEKRRYYDKIYNMVFKIRDEWAPVLHDFVSYDGERLFTFGVVLRGELTYLPEKSQDL